MKANFTWKLLKLSALILSILVFTPLVTPKGRHEPFLFGLPYTLWVGFLISALLVLLTWLGTHHHPGRNNTKSDG